MDASLAFVNGAGNKRDAQKRHDAGKKRGREDACGRGDAEGLSLLNVLLSSATAETPRPAVDEGKSKDKRQTDEDGKTDTVPKPGAFRNDPDDPNNPNQVRERHPQKLKM